MGQEEFVIFLMKMTDGELSFDRFADLPPLFNMIFFTAACKKESECLPGNKSQFEIGDTANPNDDIQLLCQQTLTSTFNTAQSVIEYFIRLSPHTIVESNLATCISTAAVNVLLEEHAGCPVLAEVDAINLNKQRLRNPQYYAQNSERHQQRGLESLGSARTNGDSACAYDIVVSVDRFTALRTLQK
jgi:6-phosphofructokinase